MRGLCGFSDLVGALGEQVLLERECLQRLLPLGVRSAVVLQQLASPPQLGAETSEFLVCGEPGLAHRLRLLAQLVELAVQGFEAAVCLASFCAERLEFATARRRSRLGLMKLRPKIGEPGHEVLALLLQEQQTRVEALENRLHTPTLLGEVPYEQPLLLEHHLELLQLALLLC